MYTRKLQHSFQVFYKPNLQTQIFLKYIENQRNLKKSTWFVRELFIKNILSIPRSIKNDSRNLLRVWQHQCECVVAQRIRRGHQMFTLYSKLWEEHALKQFITNIRRHLVKRGKELVLSSVGVAVFNWEENRIPEEELRTHFQELEYIKVLKDKTLKCSACNEKNKEADQSIIAFCECDTRRDVRTYDNWSLFIEKPDLIVWRRPHPSGSFEYKAYGSYNDVTAEDFLSVQIDTTYRKSWDPIAVELNVIEKDQKPDTNSDIVYWEMQWPRLFSNRDYVFQRRFLVDKQEKTVMLLSKATNHPDYPHYSHKYRIDDYWSSMVIKPYTEIDKPGIEFSLTYFDNPGVNIPASVTAWVAYRAMPDFLSRLRAATLKYKKFCEDHHCKGIYQFNEDGDQRKSKKPSEHSCPIWSEDTEDDFFDMLGNDFEVPETELARQLIEKNSGSINHGSSKNNLNEEALSHNDLSNDSSSTIDLDKKESNDPGPDRKLEDIGIKTSPPADTTTATVENACMPVSNNNNNNSLSGAEILLSPSPIVQGDNSYWKYLQPTYYIS